MEDYKKKYEDAIEMAKKIMAECYKDGENQNILVHCIKQIFPELTK